MSVESAFAVLLGPVAVWAAWLCVRLYSELLKIETIDEAFDRHTDFVKNNIQAIRRSYDALPRECDYCGRGIEPGVQTCPSCGAAL